MELKSFWKSKTLWLNILAGLIAVVQATQGQPWFNPEYQVFILAILNALVRLFTNTGINGTPGGRVV